MKYEFRVGDRVQYNREPSPSRIAFNPSRAGTFGTVVEKDCSSDAPRETLYIEFDGNTCSTPLYCGNITKISSNDEEIEKALAFLNKYGKVEFKKNKPPFVNKIIKINNSYDAVVTETQISVGCQTVKFSVIDELAEAVAVARKYNQEK